jgi:hypothetical protein
MSMCVVGIAMELNADGIVYVVIKTSVNHLPRFADMIYGAFILNFKQANRDFGQVVSSKIVNKWSVRS